MVALLLTEKTVKLWKLKAGVSRQLGNTAVDPRSHYQRIKRWLGQEKAAPGRWIQMVKAVLSLLSRRPDCLIIDGSSWKKGVDRSFSDLECALQRGKCPGLMAGVEPFRSKQPMASATLDSPCFETITFTRNGVTG